MSARERSTHANVTALRGGADIRGDLASSPWVIRGVVGGLVAAAIVAVFFHVVDILAGRPFYTPAALGSNLILGQSLDPGEGIPYTLVFAYGATHTVVFVAFGVIAAGQIAFRPRLLGLKEGAVLATILFAVFQATFLSLAGLFAWSVLDEMGIGRVAVANLLASAGLAGYLVVASWGDVRAPADLRIARH
jgi:hypothetical protein